MSNLIYPRKILFIIIFIALSRIIQAQSDSLIQLPDGPSIHAVYEIVEGDNL